MILKRNIITILLMSFLCLGIIAGDLSVLYKCNKPDTNSDTIKFFIEITNNSNNSIAMQDLEVRYYYSKEGTNPELCQVYYAQIGSSNVNVTCHPGYISLTFTPGAGNIPAGWDSGIIELGIAKNDRSRHNQANDYSFDAKKSTLSVNEKITLHKKGMLIFGKEPAKPNTTGSKTATPEPTAKK